nr:YlcI/YnfO family protein [Maliibacterium massiliense]
MRKFHIPSIPKTINRSIRFPVVLIDAVQARIRDTSCSFSAFVIEAVRAALDSLEEEQ